MSDIATLKAEPRERVGKGSARAARREGRVPAVIYGNKQEPISITVAHNELMRLINRGGFLSSALDIEIKGKKERVLPRDVQLHPVTDWPIHVDFLRLSRDATVNIFVPVHVVNQEASPGIKRGGVLNLVRHEVELTCPADAIPEHIVIDVTGLEVGDSVHISAVKLPEGVTPVIQDRDFTIATIQAPSGLKSEEAEEAAAEGENKE
jgi:large subunit ribosomal protein L25